MINLNQAILSGNVVSDAEVRYTKTGKPVLTFRMATNKTVNNEQYATFHNVVSWVDSEENGGLMKGDFVTVIGEIRNRKYKAQDGTDKYISEIVATNITVGVKKNESNFNNFNDETVSF